MFDFKQWCRIYLGASFGPDAVLSYVDGNSVRVDWAKIDNNRTKKSACVIDFDQALIAQLQVSNRQAEIGEKLISRLAEWTYRSDADKDETFSHLLIGVEIAQLRSSSSMVTNTTQVFRRGGRPNKLA